MTSSSPRCPVSSVKLPDLTQEAFDFLEDLSNYVPLGCLGVEGIAEGADSHTFDYDTSTALSRLSHSHATTTLYSNLHRLATAGWIQLRSFRRDRAMIFRIYLLPADVGLRYIERNGFQSKKLYTALEAVLQEIDTAPETWEGRCAIAIPQKFDMWASPEPGSLYYMFNTLQSPAPSVAKISSAERYTREALEDLLNPSSTPGLKTELMPYQRRSAGLMLQREVAPQLELDPRLEKRTAPDGSAFYYNARELSFLRDPVYQETCRGGILAETMGLGKTVMLLALILATKHHPPIMPEQYRTPQQKPTVAKLSRMAISAINRKSIPWRVEIDRVRNFTLNNDLSHYEAMLNATPARYEIMTAPTRWNRNTMLPAPKSLTLTATTIIVVPQNLCKQWLSEIDKHVEKGPRGLRVLVMENSKQILPHPDDLRTYDVVLFSRKRFDDEARDGQDDSGRTQNQRLCRCPYIKATRIRDCTCIRIEDLYDSPLKHLHFKRLVIDEGHFFSNTGSNASVVANKLITVDHRWVVSGTPAKNLLGVEVDMSAMENLWQTSDTDGGLHDGGLRNTVLLQRKKFSREDKREGPIKAIGSLAQNFLQIRPWAPFDGHPKVEWDEYIFRHETLRGRSYSAFSSCLRRTLESIIIKTQPVDVERDLVLPALSHEVIYLQPSFYDKLTANIFTMMLIANAVASERTDADYLFHKNSGKARHDLVSNLRQSAFFWTGFSEADIVGMVKNSKVYLDKDTPCSATDRVQLTSSIQFAETILRTKGWLAMERSHELGMFIQDWPSDSADHWTFDGTTNSLLTGISPLLEAQRHVNLRTSLPYPGEGLAGAGIRALAEARHDSSNTAHKVDRIVKGSPKRRTATREQRATDVSPVKAKRKVGSRADRKSRSDEVDHEHLPILPPDSPYLRSRIVGTASAKLSYLITQVLKYYHDEKIIIFYDGKNVAYYIAQTLELLHIKHEIYDSSLPAHLKSEYVVRFDQEPQDRVLLMDIKQAAFGLNLSSASRIFFVNPVCRPDVEAQAIKRAHRIGQTRKVVVQTLVLRGTIEEKMLERSKRMTRAEHADATKLEDDGGIQEIIQSARLLDVGPDENQMAPLDIPQQLWGREGWRESIKASDVVRPAPQTRTEQGHGISREPPITINEAAWHAGRPRFTIKVGKKRAFDMGDQTNHDMREIHVQGRDEFHVQAQDDLGHSPPRKRPRIFVDDLTPGDVRDGASCTHDDEALHYRPSRQTSPMTPPPQRTSARTSAGPASVPTLNLRFDTPSPHHAISPEVRQRIDEIVRRL